MGSILILNGLIIPYGGIIPFVSHKCRETRLPAGLKALDIDIDIDIATKLAS